MRYSTRIENYVTPEELASIYHSGGWERVLDLVWGRIGKKYPNSSYAHQHGIYDKLQFQLYLKYKFKKTIDLIDSKSGRVLASHKGE